jgi:hypothetical protein
LTLSGLSAAGEGYFVIMGRFVGSVAGDREREPGAPTFGPTRHIEVAISLHVYIALHVANRKKISDLRADAGDTTSPTGCLRARPAPTDHVKVAHVIRGVMLRQIAILNYINPF